MTPDDERELMRLRAMVEDMRQYVADATERVRCPHSTGNGLLWAVRMDAVQAFLRDLDTNDAKESR